MKDLSTLSNKIISAKRANSQADTSTWEGEIDQLVYQLYGLTEDEVEIVEGK
jgi:adenine-specific DNA-methyltransferase